MEQLELVLVTELAASLLFELLQQVITEETLEVEERIQAIEVP
jgi:hypothetical protein